jgi:hypothetical protein
MDKSTALIASIAIGAVISFVTGSWIWVGVFVAIGIALGLAL